MNINMSKIINFYKEKQLPLTVAASVFLLFLSTLWHPFMYVLMVFLFVSMIFSSVQDALCLTFFLLPFSGFLIIYIGSSIFIFIVVLIKYIIGLVKKQEKVYTLPLIITLGIIIVFSSIFYGTTDYGALQGLMIVCIFLFIYFVFSLRKNICAEECLKYLFYGLVASAALGAILYYIPIAKMFLFKNWDYGLYSVKDHIFHDDGTYKRLVLLSFHENHLYALCILGIAYVSYYFLSKQKKTLFRVLFNLAGLAVLITIGVLTLSKAFVIMLFASLILFLLMSIILYKKQSLKFVLPTLVLGAVLVIVFKDELLKVLDRFSHGGLNSDEGFKNLLNLITTGRVDLWTTFLDEIFSTPQKALFGVGIFSADVVDIGPHNLYIAILYRFGMLGIVCLGVLAWSYYYSLEEKPHLSVLGFLPLILFLVMALQEACLDERLYFLVISIMLIFSKNKNEDGEKLAEVKNLEKEAGKDLVESKNLEKEGGK